MTKEVKVNPNGFIYDDSAKINPNGIDVSELFKERFPDHKYNHVHNWVQSTVIWRKGTIRMCVAKDPNYRCGITQIHTGRWLQPWAIYNGDISVQEIKDIYKKDLKMHDAMEPEPMNIPILDAIFEPLESALSPVFSVLLKGEDWINRTFFPN